MMDTLWLDLRLLLAIPVVLFLPGAGMLWILRVPSGGLEHLILAVALSLVLTVLYGLALGLEHALTLMGWLVLLPFSILGVIGLLLRRTTPASEPSRRVKSRHALMLLAAVAVLGATYQRALDKYGALHPFPYSDFWMLPKNTETAVVIGIKNGEDRPMDYELRVRVDLEIVGVWRGLHMEAGQSLTQEVALPSGKTAEAWLLDAAHPDQVYRAASVALRAAGEV